MQPQTLNEAGINTLIESSSVQENQGTSVGRYWYPDSCPGSGFEFGYGGSHEFGVDRDRRHTGRYHPAFRVKGRHHPAFRHRSVGSSPPRGKMKEEPRPKASLWKGGERNQGEGRGHGEGPSS